MKSFLLLAALSAPAFGAISITLPGASESGAFTTLNNTKYTSALGFPGYATTTNLWPSAISANTGATSSATFNKVSGGGYFAGASLYDAGTPGTFSLADASPIANLKNLIFQADVGSVFDGSPLLTINGSGAAISPTFSALVAGNYSGGFGGPPAPSSNYAWQWDLSGVVGPITSYEINWTTTPHGTIYELNVAAGDTFIQAVPEASTALLGIGALGLTVIRRRRA